MLSSILKYYVHILLQINLFKTLFRHDFHNPDLSFEFPNQMIIQNCKFKIFIAADSRRI